MEKDELQCLNGHTFSIELAPDSQQVACPICRVPVTLTAAAIDESAIIEDLAPDDLILDEDSVPSNDSSSALKPLDSEAAQVAASGIPACPKCASVVTVTRGSTPKLACMSCGQVLLRCIQDKPASGRESENQPSSVQGEKLPSKKRRLMIVAATALLFIIASITFLYPGRDFRPALEPIVYSPETADSWQEWHELGRNSQHGLSVAWDNQNSDASVRLRVDGKEFPASDQIIARGVPWLEMSRLSLSARGWSEPARQSPSGDFTAGHSLQQSEATVRVMPQLGNQSGLFQFGNHQHQWSHDGRFLFLLSDPAAHPQILLKLDSANWTTQQALQLNEDVVDFCVTKSGLVLSVDSHANRGREFTTNQTWHALVPSESAMKHHRDTLILLDEDTLKVEKAWYAPQLSAVAGTPNSNTIIATSAVGTLLVGDLDQAVWQNGWTEKDLCIAPWQQSDRDGLHFSRPYMSPNGETLVSFDCRAKAKSSTGIYNVFSLQSGNVEWQQTTEFTLASNSIEFPNLPPIGDQYTWLPNTQHEIVLLDSVDAIQASIGVPSDSRLALEPTSKTLFACWADSPTRQLKLRILRGAFSTDIVLKDLNDVLNDEIKELSKWELRDYLRLTHWPYAVLASPDGRGVVVFANSAAYWVEAFLPAASTWPFEEQPSLVRNDPAANSLTNPAAWISRSRAATALLVPSDSSNRSGTAFCVSSNGHFLTNLGHLNNAKVGDTCDIVVQASGLTPRTASAAVVRIDEELGIALLQCEPGTESMGDFVPLRLGNDDRLTESSRLVAFGYYPEQEEPLESEDSPTYQLNQQSGQVTALRRSQDELVAIQFDGVLVPGNSGGPVCDSNGNVVGLVKSGIQAFGLNFVLPSSQIQKLGWEELNSPNNDSSPVDLALDSQTKFVENAKSASALVVLPDGKGFGSAFCVDTAGWFVTNAHVVGEESQVNLVLQSGEPNEAIFSATVERVMEEADLALLRAAEAPPLDLVSLELATEGVTEEMQVFAFGFPYGDALAVNNQQYPTVSVNSGGVYSAEEVALNNPAFMFRSQLNPGNSGGPVINQRGQVVGVVFATRIGGRSSAAVPLEQLKELLYQPEIAFQDLAFKESQLRTNQDLDVRIDTFLLETNDLQVDLELEIPFEAPRTLQLSPTASGDSFRAKWVPLDGVDDLAKVRWQFKKGYVEGITADREIELSGQTYRLSTIPSDTTKHRNVTDDWRGLVVHLGHKKIRLDASSAVYAVIQPYRRTELRYSLVVYEKGQELHRETRVAPISYESSEPVERKIWFPSNLAQARSEPVRRGSLPPVRITAQFENGSLMGYTTAQNLQVRSPKTGETRKVSLQNVESCNIGTYPNGKKRFSFLVRQGERKASGSGEVAGFQEVPMHFSDRSISIDMSQATSFSVDSQPGFDYVPLMTKVDDVVAAKGGKILALHLPERKEIALYDVDNQQIDLSISLTSNEVKIAAGREKLIVLNSVTGECHRWDLVTGEQEAQTIIPNAKSIVAIAMGARSDGPVMALQSVRPNRSRLQWTQIDLATLTAATVQVPGPPTTTPSPSFIAASPNGRAFGTLDCLIVAKDDGGFESWSRRAFLQPSGSPFVRPVFPTNSSSNAFHAGRELDRDGEILNRFEGLCLPCYDDRFALVFQGGNISLSQLKTDGSFEPMATFKRTQTLQDTIPLHQRYHAFPGSDLVVEVVPEQSRLNLLQVKIRR